MTEESVSLAIARLSQVSLPTASSWPTISLSVRGRMRTASGAAAKRVCPSTSLKSVSIELSMDT